MRCSWQMAIGTLLVAMASAATMGSANETVNERRMRLERMSSVEKDELRRSQQRLLELEQQTQIRELERQLVKDPQGDKLRKVMLQYQEWLKALPSAVRSDLLTLPEEQRIPKIKEMLDRQETDRLRELAKESLTPEDVELVRVWLADIVMQRKSDLLQQLPEEARNRLKWSNDPKRIIFDWSMLTRDKHKPPALITDALRIVEDDRQRLVKKLSPKARDLYSRTGNGEQEKQTILQNWVFATFRPHPPSTQELQEFLQRLPPETRDRLENLPPEQMKAELNKRFFDYRRRYQDGKRPPYGDRNNDRSGETRKGGPTPRPDHKTQPEPQSK